MTTNTTQYLDRGEGRIAYDVTGSGPLVVAVPGMGDLRSTYRHLAPPWSTPASGSRPWTCGVTATATRPSPPTTIRPQRPTSRR